MSGRIDGEEDRASAIVGMRPISAGRRRVILWIVVALWAFSVAWLAAGIAVIVFGSSDLRTGHLATAAGLSALAWAVGTISRLSREADRMRLDVHAALAQAYLAKGALEWAWTKIESMRPIALVIDRLLSAPGGAATSAFAVPACADCGERPAVCVGSRDSRFAGPSPACGECCGHGREDGGCRPLSDEDWVQIGAIA